VLVFRIVLFGRNFTTKNLFGRERILAHTTSVVVSSVVSDFDRSTYTWEPQTSAAGDWYCDSVQSN
jgi:hypothetical protein